MGRPRSIVTMDTLHLSIPERDLLELRLHLPMDHTGAIKRNELSKFFAARLREWLDQKAREQTQAYLRTLNPLTGTLT